jgi:tetratricopeptide (TPR) repeat protein
MTICLLTFCLGNLVDPSKLGRFPSTNTQLMSKLPTILSSLALAGVVVLFLLFFAQRSSQRELRAMILNERANAALSANAAAEADELLGEVLDLNPDTPNVWRRRAIARMMAGQNYEAIAAAREHLAENPADTGMSALLGAALILTKDYDGADQTLVTALQAAPLQRDLIQNLSELRRLQDRPAEAAALIDQYLEQNPQDGFFQYKRAMAEVDGDLTDKRRRDIAAAIAEGNASAGIYVVAAAIDFKDGNADQARQKLEAASQRASMQDMRTMLEDVFFREYINFGDAAGTGATGSGAVAAPTPSATPAAE